MQYLETIRRTIGKHGLVYPGSLVLAAVSGGADSIYMLHALHALADDFNIRLSVAHLHHGLRGEDADADQQLVTDTARKLGLQCRVERVDVGMLAGAPGISIEMAAREARWDFLRRTAFAVGAGTIAVGHTMDDEAETMLLRLCTGSGRHGLGGMGRLARRDGLRIVRPLRDMRHKRINAALLAAGIAWREDRSNRDFRYRRNLLRHELLPALERDVNPRAVRALVRCADLLRDDEEWLRELTEDIYCDCREGGLPPSLDASGLRERHVAARRRVLRRWLRECGVAERRLTAAQIESIDAMALSARGSAARTLPGGLRVVRRYDRLSVEKGPLSAAAGFLECLPCPGTLDLREAGWRVSVRRGRAGSRAAGPRLQAAISPVTVDCHALMVRPRRPGDRIRLAGMEGRRKVKDVMIELRLPRDQRDRLPLLVSGREVVWVPGARPAQGWCAYPGDDAWLVEILPLPRREGDL